MAAYSTTTAQTDSDGLGSFAPSSRTETIADPGGSASPARSAIARAGTAIGGAASTTDVDLGHRQGQYIEPTQVVGGIDPGGVAITERSTVDRPGVHGGVDDPTAAYIPSAYFRNVSGTVVNEKGKPIEKAKWLVAQDGLPTAAPVKNSQFSIYLLRSAYQNFVLIAESDQPGLDYVWYQWIETVVDTGDNDVILVFEQKEVTSGLNAGIGVSMG